MRRLLTLTAALVAVVGVTAGTGSAASEPRPSAAETTEAWVVPLDREMRPIGPARRADAAPPSAIDRAAAKDGRAIGERRGLQSLSGCRGVDVARIGRTLLGFVAYKWHQVKGWCWAGGKVTRVDISTYISDVDSNMRFRGELPPSGGYYNWSGVGSSGHWSFRQGSFENCVVKYGCIGSEYPWVKIWVHADGSYSYDTGR